MVDMYVDGVLDTTISPTNAGNNNPIAQNKRNQGKNLFFI